VALTSAPVTAPMKLRRSITGSPRPRAVAPTADSFWAERGFCFWSEAGEATDLTPNEK
jgi:hypothetical protein